MKPEVNMLPTILSAKNCFAALALGCIMADHFNPAVTLGRRTPQFPGVRWLEGQFLLRTGKKKAAR
ncbi:MAG: hypothetical protein QM788_05235 [Roseateles sp.]|uniref:hypothetical protein n=1 Tax=Roseateles sp. TaxID=1971397 RepID=UPI0039E7AF3C